MGAKDRTATCREGLEGGGRATETYWQGEAVKQEENQECLCCRSLQKK